MGIKQSSASTVALVTGASRGLGYALSSLLAHQGVKLCITARDSDRLERAAQEFRKYTDVVALAGDVADARHAQRSVGDALSAFGKIDFLINNASELGPSPLPQLDQLPVGAFERVLRVNVVAPLHLIQLVLPHMKSRNHGVIVNVSSDAGVAAYPGWGGYGASKAALEHMSRILTAELEGSNIRVYVVDPGDMNTEMHRQAEPGVDLSHLPDADGPAAALVQLLEEDSVDSGRFELQKIPFLVKA